MIKYNMQKTFLHLLPFVIVLLLAFILSELILLLNQLHVTSQCVKSNVLPVRIYKLDLLNL